MTKRAMAIAVGVFALLVVAAALLTDKQPDEAPPLTPTRINIGISKSTLSALILVAEAKGLFVQEGLDARLHNLATGKAALQAMMQGQVEVATASEFVTAMEDTALPDLRILASISSADSVQLIGRKDRGIAAAEQLAGKRIGVSTGTIGDYFLGSFLAFNGLSLKDVATVDLLPTEMAQAVADGVVDAAITWPPFTQQIAHRLGDRAVTFPAQQQQSYFFLLLAGKTWTQANPRVAERLLTALTRAEEWVAAHPDEARRIIAERIGAQEADLAPIWDHHRFTVTLPQSLLVAMDGEARWAIQKGLVTTARPPDFSAMVEPGPLTRVKPAAVGVFR